MSSPTYDALRIRLEPVTPDSKQYRVYASSPTGDVTGSFTVPVSELELDNLVLRMNRARSVTRGPGSNELQSARRFGGELFSALFDGPVRDLYRESYATARQSRKGLRITLTLTGAPALMDLPWEYLYERPDFISISTWTPVVRYLELPHTVPPVEVTPPLRVLGLVSSPSDVKALDVEKEKRKLEQALSRAIAQGSAKIQWVDRATLADLGRALRLDDFHVFHYIGHSAYIPSEGGGVLLLEDEEGRSRRVTGEGLATMLANKDTLRLAVLNSCEGARASTTDPFAGIATSLVERQIPAVVAMQFEITDDAAIIFADEFYAAIADGYPIDSALAEARRMIYAGGNETEWATPVLFMRVPDGRIFDVSEPAQLVDRAPETPPPVPPEQAPPLPPQPAVPLDQPVEVPEPQPISLVWSVLVVVVGLLFVVGLLYPWDELGRSWVDRHFGPAPATANVLSALSPLVLIAGTFLAVLFAHRWPTLRLLAGGLLVGLGVAGAAKYGGLVANQLAKDDTRTDSVVVLGIVAVASLGLAVLGTKLAAGGPDRYATGASRLVAGGLALVGAGLVIAGSLLDYNGVTDKSVLGDDGWFAADPLVGALVAVGAILVGRGTGRAGAGALLAIGAVGVALWPRFIGVPILLPDSLGSAAPGGFVGLLGSSCIVAAGLVLAWPQRAPAASPSASEPHAVAQA